MLIVPVPVFPPKSKYLRNAQAHTALFPHLVDFPSPPFRFADGADQSHRTGHVQTATAAARGHRGDEGIT